MSIALNLKEGYVTSYIPPNEDFARRFTFEEATLRVIRNEYKGDKTPRNEHTFTLTWTSESPLPEWLAHLIRPIVTRPIPSEEAMNDGSQSIS